MNSLSHVDDEGRAKMVDVGSKVPQKRLARAVGAISMSAATAAWHPSGQADLAAHSPMPSSGVGQS